jgi:D-alanyl-D-alanine carboxypeptidase
MGDIEQIDSYLQAEMKRLEIPGLSIALLQNGSMFFTKSYGVANIEWSVPITLTTVHGLASATKLFTGIAIMLLVEASSLSLDDEITQVVSGLPAAWRGVTIRHCLTHTSGIPDFVELANNFEIEDEVIAATGALPVEFQPGEKWAYNQNGDLLLGRIIEAISGVAYSQFMAERVFQPLGMETTRFRSSSTPNRLLYLFDVIKERSGAYHREDGLLRNAELFRPSWRYPSAGLYSTIPDLCKWDAALYTEELLKQASLVQLW